MLSEFLCLFVCEQMIHRDAYSAKKSVIKGYRYLPEIAPFGRYLNPESCISGAINLQNGPALFLHPTIVTSVKSFRFIYVLNYM